MSHTPPPAASSASPGRLSALPWLLRFGLAFGVLNTLLTFENRWPGFGLLYMPRLSFELCIGVAMLMAWVSWRGRLSAAATTWLSAGFMALVAVRYAFVTVPAVLGRPVNVYWDGRHAGELLRVAAESMSAWQLAAGLGVTVVGVWLLGWIVRTAIRTLAASLTWPVGRPWVLGSVAALSASFVAYVPDVRDTRWFFSLPLTPTIVNQSRLLAQVWLPERVEAALGPSPAFDGGLSGLEGPQGRADVVLIFAESYGAVVFDQPDLWAALAPSRAELAQAIALSGRQVVSARITAPTFGGSSWLSHATLLSGVNTAAHADHHLLLASQRQTLVSHFARNGYRTVGWMPGLKRPWPEGAFYGFDRLADDAGMGYRGPDFGYWRIPDQAAMALLHEQELRFDADASDRKPRLVVFPTTTTHAPFHPIAPLMDWHKLTAADGGYRMEDVRTALANPLASQRPTPNYLASMRYQYGWMASYLKDMAPRPLVWVVVGDHQPPALVSGQGATWDVPVHVIADDPALMRILLAGGFVQGLELPAAALGPMEDLTPVLLKLFDGAPPEHAEPIPSVAVGAPADLPAGPLPSGT
ncbi:hypothetical protein J2W49_000897 [Hydrogenophaga palleronii]|uniref:Sulfatase N-terminal domain-containing protein n=1 Tax=Hydrogenophaga palleronii TaxID=65655 RepID=A0ABU1WI70_9BURK|nr:hypothetical protein [Hydrogenophaga palleronii]MDR7148969.1 hypothetical protein [Hydrogenophaga palleronii]